MKHVRTVIAIFITLAGLQGCGSGGDFGETTVSQETPPPQNTSYSPCGTYNGQPVVCQPLRPDFSIEVYGAQSLAGRAQ
jgi:hypothetical protein